MRVLLCVDEDGVLDAVLSAAHELVELTQWDELLVLHVVPNAPLLLANRVPRLHPRIDALLESVQKRLSALPVAVETVVKTGDPAESIVRAADEHEVDLIVIGARGHRRDFPVGSVSQKVVSLADTDVLVVREPPREAGESDPDFRTLITVDGSNGSEAGITSFTSKLQAERATIHLVHIIEALPSLWAVGSRQAAHESPLTQHAERVLERAASILAARGLEAHCEWRHGSPATQILEFARQRKCQLIVVGSQGHSRLTRMMLAPITQRILRHAPCSVLCARGWCPDWAALTSEWSSTAWLPEAGTA